MWATMTTLRRSAAAALGMTNAHSVQNLCRFLSIVRHVNGISCRVHAPMDMDHPPSEFYRFDLLQPVADRVGIIYEKVSIIEHLRRHVRNGESVKCPMQGENIIALA